MSALDKLRTTAWINLSTLQQTIILADEAGHHEMSHIAAAELEAMRAQLAEARRLLWLVQQNAYFPDGDVTADRIAAFLGEKKGQ